MLQPRTADDDAVVGLHEALAAGVDRMLAFELGPMFHPAGRIFPLAVFRRLLAVPAVVGLKHSSLDRAQEWERLAIRDVRRPRSTSDLHFFTGKIAEVDSVIVAVLGTDSAVGKRTTALILERGLNALGWRAQVALEGSVLTVTAKDREGLPIGGRVEGVLLRPLEGAELRLDFTAAGPGRFIAFAETPAKGQWDARLTLTGARGDRLDIRQRLFVR